MAGGGAEVGAEGPQGALVGAWRRRSARGWLVGARMWPRSSGLARSRSCAHLEKRQKAGTSRKTGGNGEERTREERK